jgi:hypothetical protein
MKTEKFDTLIQTRVTKQQRDRFCELAKAAGYTPAAYLRSMIVARVLASDTFWSLKEKGKSHA